MKNTTDKNPYQTLSYNVSAPAKKEKGVKSSIIKGTDLRGGKK